MPFSPRKPDNEQGRLPRRQDPAHRPHQPRNPHRKHRGLQRALHGGHGDQCLAVAQGLRPRCRGAGPRSHPRLQCRRPGRHHGAGGVPSRRRLAQRADRRLRLGQRRRQLRARDEIRRIRPDLRHRQGGETRLRLHRRRFGGHRGRVVAVGTIHLGDRGTPRTQAGTTHPGVRLHRAGGREPGAGGQHRGRPRALGVALRRRRRHGLEEPEGSRGQRLRPHRGRRSGRIHGGVFRDDADPLRGAHHRRSAQVRNTHFLRTMERAFDRAQQELPADPDGPGQGREHEGRRPQARSHHQELRLLLLPHPLFAIPEGQGGALRRRRRREDRTPEPLGVRRQAGCRPPAGDHQGQPPVLAARPRHRQRQRADLVGL